MTPERWQQVREVLHGALELAPEQRPAFLEQACSTDQSLRQDVESLLASSDAARSGFLQSTVDRVTLAKGTRLDDYEVQGQIGSGGMGEVYRARDLRLHRDVAIKVLPSFISSDPDRLRRFEHEARAAAALNHPNVLAVFQLGTYEGAPYLVSELLDGHTLREHLRRGPLPVRKAIDYAIQIARGLATAHEKGVVHRDLKPENLFVTKEGRVKILDFGLAKLTHPKTELMAAAPTFEEETALGVVMGTVGYMAPEQVRGEIADHRADIFAFGAILYEMLSGKRAFQGATSVETMGAILKDDPPPISEIVPAVPPGVLRIEHRCLEKDPGQRFYSASDLAFALEALSTSPTPSMTSAAPAKSLRWRLALGVAVSAVLVSLAVGWYAWQGLGTRPGIKETELTTNSSETSVMAASISPDGRYLAYADVTGVYLRVLQTGEVHSLSITQDSIVSNLSWFPDGTRVVATLADSKSNVASIWVLSILGDHPRKLREGGTGAAVSPDGSQIAFTNAGGREIWLMGANGEDPHRVLAAPQGERFGEPVWHWDGKGIGYARMRPPENYIEEFALDSETITPVFSDSQITSGVSLPGGRIVYSNVEVSSLRQPTSRLLELDTDQRTHKPIGNAHEIARWTGAVVSRLNVTTDGKRLTMVRGIWQSDVYVGDLSANGRRLQHPRRLTFDDRDDWLTDWMRDSRAVVFASDRNGNFDIFKQALEQRTAEPLVSGPEDKFNIKLSPDNSGLLYFAFPGGFSPTKKPMLMRSQIPGGTPEFLLTGGLGADFRCARLPSASCVLSERHDGQFVFYALDPVKGRGRELTTVAVVRPDNTNLWDLSPDGSQIATVSTDNPARIRVFSLAAGTTHDISVSGWAGFESLTWSAEGKNWYATSQSGASQYLLFIDSDGHASPLTSSPFPSTFDRGSWALPSPDGRHLAFVGYTAAHNVWMLENF